MELNNKQTISRHCGDTKTARKQGPKKETEEKYPEVSLTLWAAFPFEAFVYVEAALGWKTEPSYPERLWGAEAKQASKAMKAPWTWEVPKARGHALSESATRYCFSSQGTFWIGCCHWEAEKLKNAFRSHILLERNKTGIQAHHRAGAQWPPDFSVGTPQRLSSLE